MSFEFDMPRFLSAAQAATQAHHGQLRKNSQEPYVLHPFRVAKTVAQVPVGDKGLHEDMVLAALLHDVLEDTTYPAEGIRTEFGPRVLSLVCELTQDMTLPKPERRQKMLDHCGRMTWGAQVVKLADRLDNLSDLSGFGPDFVTRYCREAHVMVLAMGSAAPPLAERIAARVRELEQTLGG